MILTEAKQAQAQVVVSEASPLPISSNFPAQLPTGLTENDFLTVIFERFWEQLFPLQGSLLLDRKANLIHVTPKAEQMCQAIHLAANTSSTTISESISEFVLPSSIETLCDFLIDSQVAFPEHNVLLQDDLFGQDGLRVHLQAKWITLGTSLPPCILVTLEDLTQVAQQRSHCDAFRYGLTPREREVWEYYLQGCSYSQIATQLFIAMSTVKKHMKNVYRKQRGETL